MEKYFEKEKFKFTSQIHKPEEISNSDKEKIRNILQFAYQRVEEDPELYFKRSRLIVTLRTSDDEILATSIIVKNRIIWFGVGEKYKGQKLGTDLLKETLKLEPDSWLAVGLDYPHVIKTALNAGYKTLQDERVIEPLLISAGNNPKKNIPSQLNNSKLEPLGINNSIVFSRIPGKVSHFGHGNDYLQIPLISPDVKY